MYFALKNGSGYQLYQNTIYNRPAGQAGQAGQEANGETRVQEIQSVNVIWPIEFGKGKCLTRRLRDENEESSIIRSWNGTEYYECNWTYTGDSMHVLLEAYDILITAPIISMNHTIHRIPYNHYSFTPSHFKFIDEPDISYTRARVYTTDPNSVDNTYPIPGRRITTTPMPMATAPMPMATAARPTHISLPPHITKIVLADSIRKNEVCPITSDDITETNATVTSCGHVFTTNAIKQWLSHPSSRGLCPICKQTCL